MWQWAAHCSRFHRNARNPFSIDKPVTKTACRICAWSLWHHPVMIIGAYLCRQIVQLLVQASPDIKIPVNDTSCRMNIQHRMRMHLIDKLHQRFRLLFTAALFTRIGIVVGFLCLSLFAESRWKIIV